MNARRRSLWETARQRGSSLITTLLVLVVLSTIVVAFMQSMSIERSVARSYMEKQRAQQAAESGLATVERILQRTAGSNDAYIVVANGPFTFVGQPSNNANAVTYTPLFSRQGDLLNVTNTISAPLNQLPSTNVLGQTQDIKPFSDQNIRIRISWITNFDQAGNAVSRFAFWTEDLQGRLNIQTAGNVDGPGGVHSRRTGTNTAELALFGVLGNSTQDAIGSVASSIVRERDRVLSPQSLFQVATNLIDSESDSLSSFRGRADFLDTIPVGFGYPDAGLPKYNINFFLAASNVTGLAGVISSNLPNFENRKGALSDSYVRTIAASMIDYADSDSTPTVGPDYTGIDSTPFVTVVYTKYDWYQSNFRVGGTGPYFLRMRLSTFLQLWNPSSQSANGTFQFIDENNDDIVQFGWRPGTTTNTLSVSLPPNQVQVVKFEQDLAIPTGALPLSTNRLNLISMSTSSRRSDYRYRATWNGQIYDSNRVGAERVAKVLQIAGSGPPDWSGHLPGLRHAPYSTNVANQPLGDPRATRNLSTEMQANDFDVRSGWGGMAVMRDNRYLTSPQRWQDPSRNVAISNPAPNLSIALSESVTNVAQLTNGSTPPSITDAPQRISNAGLYTKVTEIGNIFDPAQWHYSGYPTNDIPLSASGNSGFGGGFSLRIGRAEHPRFATNGLRASQLLDLFAVDSDSTRQRLTSSSGGFRLNINTASSNALRSLVAGINLTNDYNVTSGTLVVPSLITDFVGAVLSRRTNEGPFLSAAQLSQLTNSSGPIFGSTNMIANQPSTFHDAAREELFGLLYELSSTRSSAFRVFAVGQALNPKTGKVTASSEVEAILLVQKNRRPTGEVTSSQIQRIHETKR